MLIVGAKKMSLQCLAFGRFAENKQLLTLTFESSNYLEDKLSMLSVVDAVHYLSVHLFL